MDTRNSFNQNKKLKLAKEVAELEKLEGQRNSTLSRLIDDFLDIAQGNAKRKLYHSVHRNNDIKIL